MSTTKRATVAMRFRDLDAYGHVNNSTMFNYLEEARVSLFGEDFYKTPMDELQFIVQKTCCTYIRPLLPQSHIDVVMDIVKMERSRFIIDYVIEDSEGIKYAEASTTMACFNPKTNRPASIPEWFRKRVGE